MKKTNKRYDERHIEFNFTIGTVNNLPLAVVAIILRIDQKMTQFSHEYFADNVHPRKKGQIISNKLYVPLYFEAFSVKKYFIIHVQTSYLEVVGETIPRGLEQTELASKCSFCINKTKIKFSGSVLLATQKMI